MTPDPAAAEDLLAAFEHRVLTRDDPAPSVRPAQDAASVQERLQKALRTRLGLRDPRRLHTLALLCYQFLATPTQYSTDARMRATLGLTVGTITRAWVQLHAGGLVEPVPAGRRRAYRLSRAGEDWLLAVVKGGNAELHG